MRIPSTAELLHVWELGQSQSLPQRALLLLAATWPDGKPDLLKEISIGQRDALLLDLRESLFGKNLSCLVVCPACSDRLEMTMAVSDVRIPGCDLPDRQLEVEPAEIQSIHVAEYDLDFRPPNSQDLIMIAGAPQGEDLRRILLERCFQKITRQKEILPMDELPENVMDAAIGKMSQIDAQADVQLSLSCPSCRHRWFAVFDVVSFLWSELNAWAIRLLYEVHILASRYGWSEKDILAMSPSRRRLYLEMATK